jgi:hypothetical protein
VEEMMTMSNLSRRDSVSSAGCTETSADGPRDICRDFNACCRLLPTTRQGCRGKQNPDSPGES